MREMLAQLEEENKQRRSGLSERRIVIGRRGEHVHDKERLYDAAFGQVLAGAGPAVDLEGLVDRMAHHQ